MCVKLGVTIFILDFHFRFFRTAYTLHTPISVLRGAWACDGVGVSAHGVVCLQLRLYTAQLTGPGTRTAFTHSAPRCPSDVCRGARSRIMACRHAAQAGPHSIASRAHASIKSRVLRADTRLHTLTHSTPAACCCSHIDWHIVMPPPTHCPCSHPR